MIPIYSNCSIEHSHGALVFSIIITVLLLYYYDNRHFLKLQFVGNILAHISTHIKLTQAFKTHKI